MTNEEAIRILEDRSNLFRKFQHIKESESVEISNTELNCPALLADQYRKVADACDFAINALRNQPTGEPLTLEQLREMDGQPVWIEIIKRLPFKSMWMISECQTLGVRFDFRDYGDTWLAYAYPPARIDREAWKPCECCNGAKYVYGQASAVVPNGDKGQIEKEVEGDFDYCPECGRPLTPEAWDMLKKRLRG